MREVVFTISLQETVTRGLHMQLSGIGNFQGNSFTIYFLGIKKSDSK